MDNFKYDLDVRLILLLYTHTTDWARNSAILLAQHVKQFNLLRNLIGFSS